MQQARRQSSIISAIKRLFVPITGLLSLFSTLSPASAQSVVPAEGAETLVTHDSDQYDISGGTQAGGNLFHEFDEFSLAEQETANFLGDSGVFNIVGQVSGLAPSYIDGTVQVSGSDANLYLINPAGILFGENAQLSLQGSFTATTADQVEFGEDWLDVLESGQADYSGLTADPSAFRFTDVAASAVVNQGDLAVAAGESLSLVGGNVLNTGSLKAPGGDIGLVAVGGESTVRFGIPGSLLSLEIAEGDISLGSRSGSLSGGGAGGFSATDLPDLLTGGPSAPVSRLTVEPDGTVRLAAVLVEPEEVAVIGEISTRSETGDGGAIALLGSSVDLSGAVVVDASGNNGGTVLMGGGFVGQDAVPDADVLLDHSLSVVRADGLAGKGGNIFVGASNRAQIRGTLSAQGTTAGGFVETSADYLNLTGTVETDGQTDGGSWLIDPVDFEIVDGATGFNKLDPTTIENSLDSGTDVEITTTSGTGGSGDITLSSSIDQLGGGTANLTLTGRRFETNGSQINLTSTGNLTFEINQVNPEALTDERSIESAIAAIGNVNGNRLLRLGAGTYDFTAPVSINTEVEIDGVDRSLTLLRATTNNRVFNVLSSGNASLRNLTFGLAAAKGGGISNQGGTLTVENSLFLDNFTDFGGAIFNASGGALTVDSSSFMGNRAAGSGGAIFLNTGSVATLDDLLFQGNQAADDAGALQIKGSDVTLSNSAFNSNSATDDGGAVGVTLAGDVRFDRVSFTGNSSDSSGGAIVAWRGATLDFNDVTLSNNTAVDNGGAINVSSGSRLSLVDSTLNNNQVTAGRGGGLYLDDSVVTITQDSAINNNVASETGGGIHTNASALTLEDTSIIGNAAGRNGGGIYSSTVSDADDTISINRTVFASNQAGTNFAGGGFYGSQQSGAATFSDTDFQDNEARLGGALATYATADITVNDGSTFTRNRATHDGGAINVGTTGNITVADTTFTLNEAVHGGGAIAVAASQEAALSGVTFSQNMAELGGGLFLFGNAIADIAGSTFDGNTASSGGGIRAVDATVKLLDSDFNGNAAAVGGGLDLRGTSSSTIVNTLFDGNTATDNGGGIHAADDITLTLEGVTLSNNTSDRNGGGLFASGVTLTASSDTQFNSNSAVSGGGISAVGSTLALNGATFNSNTAVDSGGALRIQNNSTAALDDVSFVGNTTDQNGGAIHAANNTSLEIESATFEDNRAVEGGGGLNLSENSTASIDGNSEFVGNGAGTAGGAIRLNTGASTTVEGTLFDGNSADFVGGAIKVLNGSSADLSGAVFVNNTSATQGGAVHLGSDTTANVANATVFRENASGSGGGVYASGAIATIQSGTRFENNRATAGNGGGLAANNNSSLALSDLTFNGNTAALDGGGLAVNNSDITLQGVGIFNNTATAQGGGIAQQAGSLSVSAGDIRRNVAGGNGGGIALADSATTSLNGSTLLIGNRAEGNGGALATASTGRLDVSGGFWASNQAQGDGGGLYKDSSGAVALSSMTFQENTAGVNGGGLSLLGAGSVAIDNSTLTANESLENGGALHLAGSGSAVLTGIAIDNNSAGASGGGLSQEDASELSISGATVLDNRAGEDGGAIASHAISGRLTLSSANFENNVAGDSGGAIAAHSGSVVDISMASFFTNESERGDGGAVAIHDDASLTVMGTTFEENTSADQGGAIYTDSAAAVDVTTVVFNRNEAASDGGAIANNSTAGTLSVVGSILDGNRTQEEGGAVFTRRGSTTKTAGSQYINNESIGNGGGITSAGELTLENVLISDNTSQAFGGGLAVAGQTILSANSRVDANRAENGGGIAVIDDGALTLTESTIEQNTANRLGGGLYVADNAQAQISGALVVDDSGAAISASTRIENNSAQNDGGGINTTENGRLELEGVLVRGNQAGDDGGGVALTDNATATITESHIEANVAGDDGGGVYRNNAAGSTPTGQVSVSVTGSQLVENEATDKGGGLFLGEAAGVATIQQSEFRANSAAGQGGGLYGAEDITLESSEVTGNSAQAGAGLFLFTGDTVVDETLFEGNQAGEHGGGVAVVFGELTVSNSTFQRNQATIDGGGIRLAGEAIATVETTEFDSNQAGHGAGLELSGTSTATVSDSEFVNNAATRIGGGILVDDIASLTLERSTLAENRAIEGGGIYSRGTAEIASTTVSGNAATGDGGGIKNEGVNALLTLHNSTLYENEASQGGGIVADSAQATRVLSSIIAGNTAAGNTVARNNSAAGSDVVGSFEDQGNNLIGSAEGSSGFANSLFVGTASSPINPRLAPLADNGGPTRTHLLLSDSVAVNSGRVDGLLATDQRGLARVTGHAVDIGAVELDAAEIPPNSVGDVVETVFSFLDPTLLAETGDSSAELLGSRDSETLSDNASVRRLEQNFGQGFKDYWDLSQDKDLSFDDVQAILRRAQADYEVNSAVIYAAFVPEEKAQSEASRVLQFEPEPAGDDLLHLSVVMPEGELVRYALPVTRREAERQVRMLRSTASDPEDNFSFQPLSQQLYQWLLAPLEADLAAQGIQNLMYALDAGLRTAPVTAMRDNSGFSLERYGISVVPSVSLMQADFPVSVRRSTIAMGVSEFELEQPLPAVPIELEVVKSTVPASQTLLNENTTSDAIATIQALEQPGVLHLATHATFDRHSPDSSAIHLWDGLLSMREFSELDWRESNLELLILSACDTAMSSRNAELGFAGLAAAAGVDATVGSLWQVSDIGTLALMSEFYAQLESTPLRFEALRRAQLSLLNGETRIENGNLLTSAGEVDLPDEWDLPSDATLAHPFYWSAFTMVGNPW